jgi:DnaJ like chaperone protein
MGYWGKVIGGIAGMAVAGPPGAVIGAAIGHAADAGALPKLTGGFSAAMLHPARMAAMFVPREQIFAIAAVSLAAKLARCDGPVNRAEIDAFKRNFRIPPDSMRDIGRLFDQARSSPADFEPYARQLGESFADNRGLLEDVLAALFAIARADGEVNGRELDFLARSARGFGLDGAAWDRVRGAAAAGRVDPAAPDPYAVLGVSRDASPEVVRAAWKRLMRENHPDSLAGRGVPPEFIARASENVARINAAWDRIKRERGL